MINLDVIQRQVEQVIIHSQDYEFPLDMQDSIQKWYIQKEYFINKFNGPILKLTDSPISISLTQEQKNEKFDELLKTLDLDGYLKCHASNGMSLGDFLLDNKKGLFSNRVVNEYPDLKIHSNMKLMKCFKYFIPSFQDIRKAQDCASRYVQEDKFTGNLYLSVHPLDFLSVSENNGWRSCHALDGEFRSGNLSYMLDNTTFIAYLAMDDKVQLKAFPDGLLWNKKIWRILLHTNGSVIYYNRQYPFNNEQLLTKVYELANQKIFNNDFARPKNIGFKTYKFNNRLITSDYNYIMGERECIYDTRDVIDDSESMGYTDLVYSEDYTPIVSRRYNNMYSNICYETTDKREWDKAFHDDFDITIGKKVKCVKCGRGDIGHSNSFLCEDCIMEYDLIDDNYEMCDCCGRRIYPSDPAYLVENEHLCETCYSAIKIKGDQL